MVRSTRRTRTVSAQPQDDGSIRLLVPARSSGADLAEYIEKLVPRVQRKQRMKKKQQQHRVADEYLLERAHRLAAAYLPELSEQVLGELTVVWVSNQNTRWGSCTPAKRAIRISHLVQGAADYVIDYVVFHEVVHLLEAHHNAKFRSMEARFPRLLEAKAYLEGISHGQKLGQES